MAEKIKGITIVIDGETTQFEKAMRTARGETNSIKKELKELDKALKLDPKNTELLAQKQKVLAENVENVTKKMSMLKQAEKEMAKELESGNLEDSKYRQLQRDLIKVEKELKNAESAAKNYNQTLESVGLQMQNFGEKATKAGQALLPLSAGAGLILTGAAAAGMELEAMSAKYNTVFEGYTEISDNFIEKFQQLTPATTAQAQAMAAGIQDLLVPMGYAKNEATNLTGEFMHVIGALANFNSGTETSESVSAKFQAAITGETQGLKSLGIQLDQETIKRKAVEMGLATSTNEVSKQAIAQVILAESYNQSKDALAAYNEENLDAKTKLALLKAEITDILAQLGESLLPIINSLVDGTRNLVERFDGMSDGSKKLITTILLLVTAIAPLLMGLGQMSMGLGALVTSVPKIAGLFSAFFGILKLGSAGVGAGGVVAAASAGPLGLVIAGIGILIAVIAILWGNMDTIINKFKEFWEWIIKVKDAMKEFFTDDNMDKYSLAVQSGQREAKTSRFSGLSYVPFDNFLVEAHKGERILTKEENKNYTTNKTSSSTITITVQATNIKELNDLIRIAENAKRMERMGTVNG